MFKNPLNSMFKNPLNSMFNNPLNNPLNSMFNNPLNSMVNNPLNSMLNNPLNNPLNSMVNNPLNSMFNNPLNSIFNNPLKEQNNNPLKEQNNELNNKLNNELKNELNNELKNELIKTNYDINFYNYDYKNRSIDIINNICEITMRQANKNSYPINFNPSLLPIFKLEISKEEIIRISNKLIIIMNSITKYNDVFIFDSIIPIIKEKVENQIKLIFNLNIKYLDKNNIDNNFILQFNVIILFEKIYQNEDDFFKNNETSVNTYLTNFSLINIQ
jgi:hypothetical protein